MSAGMWVAVVGLTLIGTAALVWLFATTRGIDDSEYDQRPLVPSPYTDLGLSCPHGVRWYAEPTSEQRAAWARDGVR